MNIYNGFGGAITSVTATHTTEQGSTQQLVAATLASGAAASSISITAYSDQDDNWTLQFIDSNNAQRTIAFNDASFKSEDNGGTVIFNISSGGVKLCFPQSDDNFSAY